ncbi:hypothetical protein [Spirosoma flavum]|uniref:Uncharacterized protein n=1 Tax=Spirosoma flavum TaxID=2048557 RepID=A0ABW6ASA4_9BACT
MKATIPGKVNVELLTIFESISQRDWVIKGWVIHFLFSEKKLQQVKKLSKLDKWYEDPLVIHSCIDRLQSCFNSIQKFHTAFGVLPQVGDRLYDEDSGMIVQDRSIDGDLMVISFTLST